MATRWERCEAPWILGAALGSSASGDLRLVLYLGAIKLMIARRAYLDRRDSGRASEAREA